MLINKVKNGEIVRRMITHCGRRICEQIQPNKEVPGTYDRYFMPSNRDTSQAILQNYALELNEVETLLEKPIDQN